ncbi:MAG: hypothetical protein RMJ67_01345 [Elusimicrobiota bacterium]|nr:hypothetical protein [Endomicrobiia bacterium]MDW8165149.1 hypothetical protein [Elusimicrobiota bacterium]
MFKFKENDLNINIKRKSNKSVEIFFNTFLTIFVKLYTAILLRPIPTISLPVIYFATWKKYKRFGITIRKKRTNFYITCFAFLRNTIFSNTQKISSVRF